MGEEECEEEEDERKREDDMGDEEGKGDEEGGRGDDEEGKGEAMTFDVEDVDDMWPWSAMTCTKTRKQVSIHDM